MGYPILRIQRLENPLKPPKGGEVGGPKGLNFSGNEHEDWMMDAKDKKRALEAIGLMLAGFPSSQAAITEYTADAYLRAVGHCAVEAVEAACTAFLRGQVSAHNNDFPPTAPRLASLADALGEAARSLSEGPRYVSYRAGEKPPPGYVALGGKEHTWRGPHHTKLISQK
jgi:hypothetical protein